MNFQTFLKFSKIQYHKFLTVIFARDLSTFIRTYVCWTTFKASSCELRWNNC